MKAILFILAGLFLVRCTTQQHELTVEAVAIGLEESDLLYIAGSDSLLGNWHPDAVPMEKLNDSLFRITLIYPKDTNIAFKIAPGSWDNEPLDNKSRPYSNTVVRLTGDTIISFRFTQWREQVDELAVASGSLHVFDGPSMSGLKDRKIRVWLPENYDSTRVPGYACLYMHDGQNLFSPGSASFGAEWAVDESLDSLIREDIVEDLIVVGIDNSSDRSLEYNPLEAKGQSYMDYVCEVLKPHIDSAYNTNPEVQKSYTAGSSMGGLISMALIWERSGYFGGALCMSPAIMYKGFNYIPVMKEQMPNNLPKVYIDNGGVDLESILQPGVDSLYQYLLSVGYNDRTIKLLIDPDAQHFESAWAQRFPAAISWLLSE